jgi:hypothetical protein
MSGAVKRSSIRRGCQSDRVAGGTREQLGTIGRPQNFEPHRHWRADPQRILTVVVIGAFSERMDENIEGLVVQHQPRHDFLEFFGLKDNVELRDRVWAYRLIAEAAGPHSKLFKDRVSQALRSAESCHPTSASVAPPPTRAMM